MPLQNPSGLVVPDTGTVTGFLFTGPAIASQTVDSTGTLVVTTQGGAGSTTVQDEGVTLGTATFFNFVGTGVTASYGANTATINITGGSITNNPGGTNGQVQFNSSSSFGGMSRVWTDPSGNLTLTPLSGTSGSMTPTDGLTIFTKKKAGRYLLNHVGPAGIDHPLQPHWAFNAITLVQPQGNGTTLTQIGTTISTTGTATAANANSANFTGSVRRIEYVTASPAGALAGVRGPALQWWRGNGAGLGGFYSVFRVIPVAASNRLFFGFQTATAAPPNLDPGALLNQIGVAKDGADTTYSVVYAGGAASKSNTGITAVSGDLLEVRIFARPNAGNVGVSVEQILATGQGGFFEIDIPSTGNLPASTQFLNFQAYAGNAAAAAVCRFGLVSLFIEVDN